MKPKWDTIFDSLEKWHADEESNPSVNTVAENYRNDPWAILVSTIISLRTKDEVTLKASERLLKKAGSPKELDAIKASASSIEWLKK